MSGLNSGVNLGKLQFGVRDASGSGITARAANPLELNTLHHIAGVFDGSQVKLYQNGVLVASESGSAFQTGIVQDIQLGKLNENWGPQSYSWKGPLDDIRLYDRALSAAEVTQLYQLEQP